MLTCPKCGYLARIDTASNIVCTNSKCNWSRYVDETNKGESLIQKIDEIKIEIIEINSNEPSLRYYFV